ncbi:MAG: chromate resistance protein [Gemmatimonadota bacterium]|nr:chromate resistance protein [Gemmatimonadota bacterium]
MKWVTRERPKIDRVACPWLGGADTARLDLAPQCAGLLAISLGLSRLIPDDREQLRHGFVMYDALHLWLKEGKAETHTWNPQR